MTDKPVTSRSNTDKTDATRAAEQNAARKETAAAARVSRSAAPYYIGAVLAAATMAWYFFLFVPAKIDYFVGLRLRTLAVVSRQVEARAENLALAMSRVRDCGQIDAYLAALVPDIRLYTPGAPPEAGFVVRDSRANGCSGQGADGKRGPREGTVSWDDLMRQVAGISRRDFDDLILALPDGTVVWQREANTPRVGNLRQALYAVDNEDRGWFSARWRPTASLPNTKPEELPAGATLRPVRLGARDSILMAQALRLDADGLQLPLPPPPAPAPSSSAPPSPAPAPATPARSEAPPGAQATPNTRTLYVAAVVADDALQEQAMRVPLAWVTLIALPLILLFLALPFVKLATLTTRERFRFVDLVMLVAATFTAASLGAVMPFVPVSVNDETDDRLKQLAMNIEDELADETTRIMTLLTDPFQKIATAAATNKNPLPVSTRGTGKRAPSCNPADTPSTAPSCTNMLEHALAADGLDIDVLIHIDADGKQAAKWSTKTHVTGPTPHDRFDHFKQLRANDLWTVSGSTTRFVIEPLRAPTTAELGIVFATRASAPLEGYLAVNARPRALLDVVMPPDHGFAVVDLSGNVLFHSQEDLSLGENFFEEVGEPAEVRQRIASGHRSTWSGDYHGRPHRLHVHPLAKFSNVPWRIITFQELERALATVTRHQSHTFRLALLNLLMLSTGGIAFFLYSSFRQRQVRDLMMFLSKPSLRDVTLLGVLALAGVLVLWLTYFNGTELWLNHVYLWFVALPFLALGLAMGGRGVRGLAARRESAAHADSEKSVESVEAAATQTNEKTDAGKENEKGSAGEQERTPLERVVLASEFALLVILIAALPAAGFARIADRVQAADDAAHWLEQAQQRIHVRNHTVRTRVQTAGYSDRTRDILLGEKDSGFTADGFASASALCNDTYLALYSSLEVDAAADRCRNGAAATSVPGRSPLDGQRLPRFLLEWNPFPSKDESGAPPVVRESSGLSLMPSAVGAPKLLLKNDTTAGPDSMAPPTGSSVPSGKLVLGVLIFLATLGAVHWARRRLLVSSYAGASRLKDVLATLEKDGTHNVMLIGPPRTRKDKVVTKLVSEISQRNPDLRIRLLGSTIDDAFIAEKEAMLVGKMNALPVGERAWVHVSNLETLLVTEESRRQLLRLLHRLTEVECADRTAPTPRVIIVTTAIDPVAHFEEVFDRERAGIYRDALPEVELSHAALLLSRFRRCYEAIPTDSHTDPWWDYSAKNWRAVLKWEVSTYGPLQAAQADLLNAWHDRVEVPVNDLARAIMERAAALYQLLWAGCTRREKLVLIQLAQEGFVTRQSADVVAALHAKGLIAVRREDGVPAIFNHTFRRFLRNIERNHIVREWERGDGTGLWVVAGRLTASTGLAAAVFFLVTQGYSMEGVLPIVSGTGILGIPLVRNMFAKVTGRSGGGAEA